MLNYIKYHYILDYTKMGNFSYFFHFYSVLLDELSVSYQLLGTNRVMYEHVGYQLIKIEV